VSNLRFIGDTSATSYSCSKGADLMEWLEDQQILCTDTETNVVDSILDRKLKVIALGNESGDEVWVIEWEYVAPVHQTMLLEEIRTKLNIMQNVSFDYKMFAMHGCILENVYDTMLAEQVLHNGIGSDRGFYGLQAIYQRRFGLDISKDEQLTFGEGPYTDKQIQYAAIDVLKLGVLRNLQISEAKSVDLRVNQRGNKGLMKTIWWENEFVKAVADMEMTGVRFDKDKWYAIEDSVRPIYEEELENLNTIVKKDFWDTLVENDWISDKDEFVTSIWTSSAKKKLILDEVYNFPIEKTAKTELKKILQQEDPDFPEGLKLSGKAWAESDYPVSLTSKFAILKLMCLDMKSEVVLNALNGFLMTNMKEFCIEKGWLRPANKLSINWASPIQRLAIFQAVDPAIQSTGKEVLEDFISSHVVIQHYLKWSEVEYQLKNFGKPFYDRHVEKDGKHRTRFNQILKTGRLSSVSPNLLNIPRKHSEYREALVPDPGYELLDADYDGQELIIVAIISQEKSWLEYMAKGYDIHSMNSELIFGDEWVNATEEGCEFYKVTEDYGSAVEYAYKKCECKGHMEMRDNSKAVSFGSIYGISFIKLAFNLKISEDRAKFILKRFFEIAPAIKDMMDRFGQYAITNGHIIEPVFGRVRFYDQWKLSVPEERGGIERTAFNTPIQSSGSAMLKISFVLMRRWIRHNNHQHNIQLLLPYHDETIAQSLPAYTTLAKEKVEHFMMLGAKLAGFDVKASAKSGQSWAEAH
jgi:DNA polymerase I-like protein with 3'-5' exonuclease and polymerase domains